MSETNQWPVAEVDFSACIATERERLTNQRHFVVVDIEAGKRQLHDIDRDLAAIDAYEAAKAGKPAMQNTTRTRRTRSGSRREELLNIVRNSDGLSRGEILERMGLKGDKSGEMSVSNALTALTKRGELYRDGRKYSAPIAREVMREAAE